MKLKDRLTISIVLPSTIFFVVLLGAVLGVLIPSTGFSHGWAGYEQGAKAHGMGNAFTGLADDPSAVYYNPAGIVQLDGTQGSLGFSIPCVQGQYESSGTSGMASPGDETSLKKQYFFIPNLYVTSKLSDKLSLGFGEYTIFGLGFKWPDSFEGRFAPGGKNSELTSMTLSPVVAYQLTKDLSVALGGRVERVDLTLENKIFVAPGVDEVDMEMTGDDYAIGWNTGVLYRIRDGLSVGLSYRSKMKHSFDDIDVDFTPQIDALGPIPVGLTNTSAELDVTFPQFASLGFAWTKGPLTITVDGYWWDWSQIKELKFKFDQPVAGMPSMASPMKWEDTWSYAIGTEYDVNAFDRIISFRGGFMYEQCPVPDETVGPSGFHGDNLLYNLGVGLPIGPVYSDFFFTYVYTKDRTWNNQVGAVPNPGGGQVTGEFQDYYTIMFGTNLTYKF